LAEITFPFNELRVIKWPESYKTTVYNPFGLREIFLASVNYEKSVYPHLSVVE
jgi:hypothetical protein